ncbi:receptor-transporting protein 4-like X8 [Biomphalaria pfeifferi]|uniref:Receptor-transporting protein 4-like X8 n=1 Tax=Biomphalaria pfeifferi TaxID=112525 RepID=A0AAD8FG51_BIOPF|nr:receptor-transporting protein 4-like X8 [Biomphalaria pfeifferi]
MRSITPQLIKICIDQMTCNLTRQATYLCDRKSPSSDSLHLDRSMGLMDRDGDTGEIGMAAKVLVIIMMSSSDDFSTLNSYYPPGRRPN